MSTSPTPPDDARGLAQRADALERSTARAAGSGSAHAAATSQAYKLIAELLGGVLVGLAIGFGLDRLTGVTAPWGLIGGVLLGFAVSVWMAKQTADRLVAQAARENVNPPPSVPFDDDDD